MCSKRFEIQINSRHSCQINKAKNGLRKWYTRVLKLLYTTYKSVNKRMKRRHIM